MTVAGLRDSFGWPDSTITWKLSHHHNRNEHPGEACARRMHVVLETEDWPVWLGERPGDPASLLCPPSEDVLQCRLPDARGVRSRHDLVGEPRSGRQILAVLLAASRDDHQRVVGQRPLQR